jgi:hypothetical protein
MQCKSWKGNASHGKRRHGKEHGKETKERHNDS